MKDQNIESALQIRPQSSFDIESRVYHTRHMAVRKTPKLSKNESSTISSMILPEENVLAFAMERRLHGALLNPTIVLVTDHRTIIINRRYLRMKSDIAFIDHDSIASFRVVHSLMFSSVQIRQNGTPDSCVFDNLCEGEIKGFSREGANMIANGINYARHIRSKQKHDQTKTDEMDDASRWSYQLSVMHKLHHDMALPLPDPASYCVSAPASVSYTTKRSMKIANEMVENSILDGETTLQQMVVRQLEQEGPACSQSQIDVPDVLSQEPCQGMAMAGTLGIKECALPEQACMLEQVVEQNRPAEAEKARSFAQRSTVPETRTTTLKPEDLLIFKKRSEKVTPEDLEKSVRASMAIEYPTPSELISGKFDSNKSSLFYGLFAKIKPRPNL